MPEERCDCPYLNKEIDPGLCYDLQMIASGVINPSALPDITIDSTQILLCCKNCEHNMKEPSLMKEIIAKRNKKSYIFLLVISVISMFTSVRYLDVPMLCYIAIGMLLVLGLLTVFCVYILADHHGAIERDGNTLVIRRGVRRTVININDVLDVCAAPHPNKPGAIQENVITMKVLVDGKESTLTCGDLTDGETAIKKLSALLHHS